MSKRNGSEKPDQFGRLDLDRMGLFSEMGYISSGEPYPHRKDDSFLTNRAHGKQFQTTPPKPGHDNKDAYFDKEYSRVFENEPYTDLVVLRRRSRLTEKEKNITKSPFKPSSVPPKPSGSGSLYGTIEQQWPLQKKEIETLEREPIPLKSTAKSKPNFYTKPPKKGTGYGYPNVTIGKQYEYITDPYNRAHESLKSDHEYHKQKQIGERVFISSMGKQHDFFNTFTPLAGPGEAKGPAVKITKLPMIPFKPSSYCGYTINKYPTYEPPINKNGESIADDNFGGEKKKKENKSAAIFRPSGVAKSYPSRSILEANCPIAPP
ncbi:hypothetical protein HK096_006504, partial [Nowakowskiella sp. JEL0078]